MSKSDSQMSILHAAILTLEPLTAEWAEVQIEILKTPAADLSPDQTNKVRNYLLGNLEGEERNQFENDYFDDPQLVKAMRAAEVVLVEDYLFGKFSQRDRAYIEKNVMFDERVQAIRFLENLRAPENRPKPLGPSA